MNMQLFILQKRWLQRCEKIIEKFRRAFPGNDPDSGSSGNTGDGVEGVKKSVEQAVGSDILFGSET